MTYLQQPQKKSAIKIFCYQVTLAVNCKKKKKKKKYSEMSNCEWNFVIIRNYSIQAK